MTNEDGDIIQKIVVLETLVGDFYKTLFERFPAVEILEDLYKEEYEHAMKARRLAVLHEKGNIALKAGYDVENIDRVLKYLSETQKDVKKISLETGLNIALDLEGGLAENETFEFIKAAKGEALQIVDFLRQGTKQHSEVLASEIEKLSVEDSEQDF